MENSITFSTEVPNFNDCSEFYYFITFKLDDSKIKKEISNVDLIIFSRLSYEETLKTIKYVGISSNNLFESKLIDFENKCN